VYQARNAKQGSRGHRDLTAGAGPDGVHDRERRCAMGGDDRAHRSQSRAGRAHVVDAGAGEFPLARPLLLTQREDIDLRVHRQTADERDQRRDHPVLAGTVDAPGHD
jgi:hypothetical protein